MDTHFMLDAAGDAVVAEDIDRWATWVETAHLGVARTLVTPAVAVVTTFTPMVENVEPGSTLQPFVTRVFGGMLDGDERLSPTRAQALFTHASVSEWCREAVTVEAEAAACPDEIA